MLTFFFHFDTNQHQGPINTPYKISPKYTKPFWRNGLKCQGRRKFFKGRRKFSNGHSDLIPLQNFFILISVNIKILLILHTKFQLNIHSHSGENDDFISFAIFSNGGHLEFSTILSFSVLKLWSLIMLHMKFKIHGCSGLKE